MKNCFLSLLLGLLLLLSVPAAAYADSADRAGTTDISGRAGTADSADHAGQEYSPPDASFPVRTISGFAPLPDRVFSCPREEKPSLADLVRRFPETLAVTLDGKPASLPVSWVCVGGGYEDTDFYYYQFSPVWDTSLYAFPGDSTANGAPSGTIPYIGVFLTPGDGASVTNGTSLLAVTNSSYEEEIFQYLTENMELPSAAACGIMANLYAESGFLPANLQNTFERKLGFTDASYTEAVDSGAYDNFVHDGAGYGLCQWTYWSRKQGLLDLAQNRSVSIGDLHTQLDYMRSELSSTYFRPAGSDRSVSLFRYLLSVPDTGAGACDAAVQFCMQFEKPANKEAVSAARGNLARDTYWAEYGPPSYFRYSHTDGTVTASVRYEEPAWVVCTAYTTEGRFLSLQIEPYPGGGEASFVFSFDGAEAASFKVLLLDEAVRPLSASEPEP